MRSSEGWRGFGWDVIGRKSREASAGIQAPFGWVSCLSSSPLYVVLDEHLLMWPPASPNAAPLGPYESVRLMVESFR